MTFQMQEAELVHVDHVMTMCHGVRHNVCQLHHHDQHVQLSSFEVATPQHLIDTEVAKGWNIVATLVQASFWLQLSVLLKVSEFIVQVLS